MQYKNILSIDLETYSSNDIKHGVAVYTSAPDFEIMLFGYAYNDDDVVVIDLTKDNVPQSVLDDLVNNTVMKTAFNATFEMYCIERHYGVNLDVTDWFCTQMQAMELSLPQSLEKVATVLGISDSKDKKGKALINMFTKPRKPTESNKNLRNYSYDFVDDWYDFVEYCRQDVVVERAVRKRLDMYRKYIPSEKDLWDLDYKINKKGVKVDLDLVDSAVKLDTEYQYDCIDKMKKITGLDNPKSRNQMKEWIENETSMVLENLNIGTVKELIVNCDNGTVKDVLKTKASISKTSVSKYKAMGNCNINGVIRGILQFYGASRTGRWAGRNIQVQNLPRTYIEDLENARNTVKCKSLELFDLIYNKKNLADILSQLIRTAIVPHDKHNNLVVVDFSAIEARVLAWLSGESWKLDVFRTHGMLYEASASEMFNVPLAEVDKNLRSKGKVSELALGYGGSTGALISMGALSMGIEESELKGLVDTWRGANKNVQRFWWDVEKATKKVLKNKDCIEELRGILISYNRGFLYYTLPNGRSLAYCQPELSLNMFGKEAVSYMHMNQTTKKWERTVSFGGKITENLVQAIARDCLAETLFKLDKKGYEILFHVHDEVIVECKKEDSQNALNDIKQIMGEEIEWAKGLPLSAEGYVSEYYKKD